MTRALFIPTLVSGVTYWRMYNPILGGYRTKSFDGHLLWWQKDLTDMHPWQQDIMDPKFRARITGEIDAAAKQADVVVMGMTHLPSGLMTMQGLRECYGKPVVMEVDDHFLSCPEYNPAAASYDPNGETRKITVRQLRESDAVIVTTPYLKEVYSEFNDNVYVLPNAIDIELWGKVQHRRNRGKVTIGWVGGANHNDDLLLMEPAIEYLTDKYPQVEFVFGHGMHPSFRGRKGVRWVPDFFRIDKYPAEVAKLGFDIGVAPIVDNAFNRGKSNLRWLEYSALGLPTVASDVGHFHETIEHGVTGLLCKDSSDFILNLEMLIKDKSRRGQLAQAAKNKVFKDFNIDQVSGQYAQILSEIAQIGQVRHAAAAEKESNFKQEVTI